MARGEAGECRAQERGWAGAGASHTVYNSTGSVSSGVRASEREQSPPNLHPTSLSLSPATSSRSHASGRLDATTVLTTMTSRATYLRLSPLTNRWTRTTRPFNLAKHARPLPPPPTRAKDVKEPFKTLAADLTPVPGVQVPRLEGGAREGVPRAGMALEGESAAGSVGAGKGDKAKEKVEQGATKGKEWMGVEIPLKPAAPEEGGESALFRLSARPPVR